MWEVSYFGPGKFMTHPIRDRTGRERLIVILKYTLRSDASGRTWFEEEEPSDIVTADVTEGDPATSSIRKPSDICDEKPGTDVLLVGHAHPMSRGATATDVTLTMGPVQKTLRIHGLRAWQWGTFGGLLPGPARPIVEPVPLLWELAWGGLDLSDPEKPVGDPRNTLGRGVARDPKRLVGKEAVQIEYPDKPVSGKGVNTPAGFGALCRHWEPRLGYAGTYDQAWMDHKMPLPPDDFDPRFNVTAPADQWSRLPLRGDEMAVVTGATPEGLWRIQLPRLAPGFSAVISGRRSEHRTHLDTILIDADKKTIEMTYRAAIPMPRKYELIERLIIVERKVLSRG